MYFHLFKPQTMKRPLKRHPYLQPFSRDHHQGLIFCWNIKKGLQKGIEVSRMINYCDWFYEEYLLPHFNAEEKKVFNLLPEEDKQLQIALESHQYLKSLFEEHKKDLNSLNIIESTLKSSIRFEERILFEYIQKKTSTSLDEMDVQHREVTCHIEWHDPFWKSN